MSGHVHSGVPRYDDVTMMASLSEGSGAKYMLQVHSLNLSEKSAHVCVCARVHSLGCGYVSGGLSLLYHSLSYSMETDLLLNPELDWWPASLSDALVPSPQLWVTGMWLHPGELGCFGGGGCCC